MPLTVVFRGAEAPKHPLLDIIGVCNSFDSVTPSVDSWAWITDLCHREEWSCRFMLYDYDRNAIQAPNVGTDQGLRAQASSLLEDLLFYRRTDSTFNRPLVFVCHGFGGLIVKNALVLSSEERALTPLLRSVYLSTYSVLFASTPHYGISRQALQMLSPDSNGPLSLFAIGLMSESPSKNKTSSSNPLAKLHAQFEPLTELIRVFNCWELQPTCRNSVSAYIVAKSSAAPDGARAETYGITATHKALLSFDDRTSSDFGYIANTLRSCVWHAPPLINLRWQSHAAIDRRQQPPALSGTRGHDFQSNTVSGGRAHFGDNVTYIYTANGNELQELARTSDRNAPPGERAYQRKRSNLTRTSSTRFTGRQLQLSILRQELGNPEALDAQERPRIVIIHGWGGTGKTELCLRFAEQAHHTYWGVFWIDASSRANAEDAYSAIGQDQGRGATFEAGKFWLQECPHPWLLVLDNADDPDKNLKVSELVPRVARGHVVITTRNRNVMEAFPHAFTLELRGMEPEDAVDFLLKWANLPLNTRQRATAKEVAAELGYLALALRMAGSAVRKSFQNIKEYLTFYLGRRKDLLRLDQSLLAEETDAIASWEVSFEKMKEDPAIAIEDARLLLSIFANLHFESIARGIFPSAWLGGKHNDFVLPDLLEMAPGAWNIKKSRILRAINALYDYSIIDYHAETGICSMHPVIHSWVRLQLIKNKKGEYWLSCTMELLSRTISPHLEASTRGFRRALLPHVHFCTTNIKNYLPRPGSLRNNHTALQLERLASVYAETGNWTEALALQQRVVAYFKSTLGATHRRVLAAEQVQSQIEWNRFEIGEAIIIQTRLLLKRMYSRPRWKDWSPILRPAYLDYCIALDDLTQSLWLAGEVGISRHTGKRALEWFEKNLGPIDPLTLNAKLNVARTCHHLGELEEARCHLATVVRNRRRMFGADHPDTLMARNELGMVCLARQQFTLAKSIIANVYHRRKVVLGEEHAYTLWSANDLSKVQFSHIVKGVDGFPYATRAVDLLESIIPVVARTLGQGHVGMLMTKGNLARAYVRCQRLDEAMELLEEMLVTIKETHPNWTETMAGKAEVQLRLGKLEDAEATCCKVLQRLDSTDQPRGPWIFRFIGPETPVRAADLQRTRILKLMDGILEARSRQ